MVNMDATVTNILNKTDDELKALQKAGVTESEIDMINKFRQLDLRDQEEAKAIIDMKYQRIKEND